MANVLMKLVGGSRPSVVHGFTNQPIITAERNLYGGYVVNPADDQHIDPLEPLYVSIVGPADLDESATTSAVETGATFHVPPHVSVWVNSATDRHFYAAVFGVGEAQAKPIPVPPGSIINGKPWPPDGPTGLTWVIYAYLYQEYSDDDDLQEFVKVLNEMQQDYVDTFNAIQLPIYPNVPPLTAQPKAEPSGIMEGALADWTMHGIYGWIRPTLYAFAGKLVGPLNTYWCNFPVTINGLAHIAPQGVLIVDDDFYKRTLTWHFQKGDGKYFNIRWLKRRVMRFLIGVNGTCPHIDNTDRISILFGPNWGATIRIKMRQMTMIGGAFPNGFGCNGLIPGAPFFSGPEQIVGPVVPNSIVSTFEPYAPLPYAGRFEQAVAAGILELPFQWRWNVYIG